MLFGQFRSSDPDTQSPYYNMCFPYVALAIKPNANEMYMNMLRKYLYLYYTLFFNHNKVIWGSYSNAMHLFPKTCLAYWYQITLSVPKADCYAFSGPTQP